MAKNILRTLQREHLQIFKIYLVIFFNIMHDRVNLFRLANQEITKSATGGVLSKKAPLKRHLCIPF